MVPSTNMLSSHRATRRRPSNRVFALGLVTAMAGCRGRASQIPPEAVQPWSAMNERERVAHMTNVVQPRMAALFRTFDDQRFAEFGCATCHGPGASNGTFAMPNPALPELNPRFFYRKHRKGQHEMATFMWKEVEPNMAQLLGLRRGEAGVHCGTCHRLEP